MHNQIFCGALVLIGLGSFFLHASISSAGERSDLFSMYFLAAFIAVYSFSRLNGGLSGQRFALLYSACVLALMVLQVADPNLGNVAFAVPILGALGIEAWLIKKGKAQCTAKYFKMSAGFLFSAFIIWFIDLNHLFTAATDVVQGHAIWHTLSACSAWSMHAYFVSERSELVEK